MCQGSSSQSAGGQYGTNNGSYGTPPRMPFQGGGVNSFGGPGANASTAPGFSDSYNYALGRLGQMPQWRQGSGGQFGRTGYPPPQLGDPIKPPDGLGGAGGFNGPTDQASPQQVVKPTMSTPDPNEGLQAQNDSFTPQMPGPGEGLQAQSQPSYNGILPGGVQGPPGGVPGTSFNPMSGLNGPPPGGYGGPNPGMQQPPNPGMLKPMRFDGGGMGGGQPPPWMRSGGNGGGVPPGLQMPGGYRPGGWGGANPGMQQPPSMTKPLMQMPINVAGQNPGNPMAGGNPPGGYGGPAPQQPPPPPQQTDQQRFDAQNKGLLRPQTVMDPAYFQSAAAPPPQPTGPEQPGQHGNYFGVPNAGGGDFNNPGAWGWQPNFGPGAQNYITQMMRPGGNGLGPGSNGLAPWAGQINWGDALNSIGQLSGNPYNPAMYGPR